MAKQGSVFEMSAAEGRVLRTHWTCGPGSAALRSSPRTGSKRLVRDDDRILLAGPVHQGLKARVLLRKLGALCAFSVLLTFKFLASREEFWPRGSFCWTIRGGVGEG